MKAILDLKLNIESDEIPSLRSFKCKSASLFMDGNSIAGDRLTLPLETRALLVLLGGYNGLGRAMDVDKFHLLQERFQGIIREVAADI